MKSEIKKISLSSLLSALITVLIMLGYFIEMLDFTVAAVCSLIIYVSDIEIRGKYPFLVYITSCLLTLIFIPLSSASLYFIAFFGYYPIIKKRIGIKKKKLRKLICAALFNISMLITMLVFKAVFALQNEPAIMYVLLLITLNIFFFCFDYLLDVFIFIYIKKIRPKIKPVL